MREWDDLRDIRGAMRDANFVDVPGLPEALAAEAEQARHPLETLDQDAVLARAATLRWRRRIGIVAIGVAVAVGGVSGAFLVTSGGNPDGPVAAEPAMPSAPPENLSPSPGLGDTGSVAPATVAAANVGMEKFADIFTNARMDLDRGAAVVYLTDLSRSDEFRMAVSFRYPQSYAAVLRFEQGAYDQRTCRAGQDKLAAKLPELPFEVLGIQVADDCSRIELIASDVSVARAVVADDPNGVIAGIGIPVRVIGRPSDDAG